MLFLSLSPFSCVELRQNCIGIRFTHMYIQLGHRTTDWRECTAVHAPVAHYMGSIHRNSRTLVPSIYLLATCISNASTIIHPVIYLQQSRERGITLDLGFSAFTVPAPQHISSSKYTHVQFTLVSTKYFYIALLPRVGCVVWDIIYI